MKKDIVNYIGEAALLDQTAEECSELAQACLKLSRKIRGVNPTPKTKQECIDALVEEIADVSICLDQIIDKANIISHEAVDSVFVKKEDRWIKRLEEKRREIYGN